MISTSNLSKNAIESALSHNWKDAVSLNESIIEMDPSNIEGMLRLAFAHIQLQNIEKAKKLYRKVLLLDKYCFVAQKNLNKLSALPKRSKKTVQKSTVKQTKMSPNLFLEEPGKTKSVNLINVAPISVLSQLENGDNAYLCIKRHSVEVRDENKVYLGVLPDDLSFRLLRLMQSGNTYTVIIKSTDKKSLSVFLRENKRGKRFKNQPSFLPNSIEFADPVKEVKKCQVSEDEFE